MKVKIKKIKCLRCGYEWLARKEEIVRCANPKCRSPYWNIPVKVHLAELEQKINNDNYDPKLSRKIDKLIAITE